MIQVIPSTAADTLGVAAHGTVTGDDYESVLIPAIEKALRSGRKIRFLYELGDDFQGFTSRALWDDAKVGVKYGGAFEKIAVVTNSSWVVDAVMLCSLFVSCPVKIFQTKNLRDARHWLIQ